MDSKQIKEALETINNAILEANNGNATSEEFYWWNAVLELFNYSTDGNGNLIKGEHNKRTQILP